MCQSGLVEIVAKLFKPDFDIIGHKVNFHIIHLSYAVGSKSVTLILESKNVFLVGKQHIKTSFCVGLCSQIFLLQFK